jgi:hypothetical protein
MDRRPKAIAGHGTPNCKLTAASQCDSFLVIQLAFLAIQRADYNGLWMYRPLLELFMAKHLIIAALCLETSLLAGGGVIIGQLWTRSGDTEERGSRFREQLAAAEAKLKDADRAARQVAADSNQVSEKLTAAETRSDELERELASRGRVFLQLEAQNESLQRTAKEAVVLSDEVAELKRKLLEAQLSTSTDDQLVRVQRPNETKETVPEDSAEKTTTEKQREEPVRFDDRGWKSIRD